MKPTNDLSLYNWNALNERTPEIDKLIKQRMEDLWKKKYNKA